MKPHLSNISVTLAKDVQLTAMTKIYCDWYCNTE